MTYTKYILLIYHTDDCIIMMQHTKNVQTLYFPLSLLKITIDKLYVTISTKHRLSAEINKYYIYSN